MFSIQFLHNKQITFPIEYLCLLLNSHKELLIKKFLLSVNDGENLILTIVFSLSIIISLFQTSGRILERSNMSDYVESEKERVQDVDEQVSGFTEENHSDIEAELGINLESTEENDSKKIIDIVQLQAKVKKQISTFESKYIIFYHFLFNRVKDLEVSYNELLEEANAAKLANDDECMLILFFLKSSISFT